MTPTLRALLAALNAHHAAQRTTMNDEPDLTNEQREALLRNVAAVHAAISQFTAALVPQVRAAAEAFAEIGKQLRQAGLLDESGKPTSGPDRPAWQSPYGPPPGRHRDAQHRSH